jgi:hypothetical protein
MGSAASAEPTFSFPGDAPMIDALPDETGAPTCLRANKDANKFI